MKRLSLWAIFTPSVLVAKPRGGRYRCPTSWVKLRDRGVNWLVEGIQLVSDGGRVKPSLAAESVLVSSTLWHDLQVGSWVKGVVSSEDTQCNLTAKASAVTAVVLWKYALQKQSRKKRSSSKGLSSCSYEWWAQVDSSTLAMPTADKAVRLYLMFDCGNSLKYIQNCEKNTMKLHVLITQPNN